MNNRLIRIAILNWTWLSLASGQELASDLRPLIEQFRAFEYHAVIAMAESLLVHQKNLPPLQAIEIYRLKAIAHYTLSQTEAAKAGFAAILEIDSTFALDTLQNSPKIVDFYQQVKSQFQRQRERDEPEIKTELDTPIKTPLRPQPDFAKAISRSLIWPGWGHRVYGRYTKGWVLSLAGLAAAGATAYYFFDSRQKESDYLNEIRLDWINEKYERYNFSYRRRNFFAVSFIAVWAYSQFDLFSLARKNTNTSQSAITPLLLDAHLQPALGMKIEIDFSLD
ncbi:hypothetical protein L0337_33190 [candidate division KSB1 bacterium]|nr:hypothetical protein [candidate division KSB1 bacterium]